MMLRRCLALCLTILLTLTSVTAAVARGQMAGATEMVVCAGGGTMTVTMDAAGRPVAHVRHCPVCTAASAAVAGAVAPVTLRPVTRSEVVGMRMAPRSAGGVALVAMARGPPALV